MWSLDEVVELVPGDQHLREYADALQQGLVHRAQELRDAHVEEGGLDSGPAGGGYLDEEAQAHQQGYFELSAQLEGADFGQRLGDYSAYEGY